MNPQKSPKELAERFKVLVTRIANPNWHMEGGYAMERVATGNELIDVVRSLFAATGGSLSDDAAMDLLLAFAENTVLLSEIEKKDAEIARLTRELQMRRGGF
jgi:hypothetical protein